MSYILDALKKSEKKRQRGTVPDLLTMQEALAHEQKKRPLWAYMIMAALLLNALLLVWLVPWKAKKSNIPLHATGENHTVMNESSSPASDLSQMKPQELPADVNRQKPQVETPSDEISSQSLKRNQQVQPKADVQKKMPDELKSVVDTKMLHETAPLSPSAQPDTVAHVSSEPKPENNITPPVPNKIYSLSELPSSIQQSLPAFAISVFLYSNDPNARTVKVNGQMMKEGQYLSAGLKLEEITQNEAIFSYQNYRFRVGMK
jgi:general secretion pathway protein B